MVKLTMTIKHVSITRVVKPSGKVFRYALYRRTGQKPIRMQSSPDDELALKAEADRLGEQFENRAEYVRGELGWLVDQYKASVDYPDNPATRISYERAFAILLKGKAGKIQAHTLARPALLRWRNEVWLPDYGLWAANNAMTVLRLVMKHGLDIGAIRVNPLAEPVRKLRKPQGAPRANRPWTPQERAIVLEHAPASIRLPLTLAMCAGWRKADLFRATLSAIKDGEITIKTSKRGTYVRAPIHAVLADAIQARPPSNSLQLCVRSNGRPMTATGFDTLWHRLKSGLEAEGKIEPGLTIHGLRHSLGHMLKEAGLPDAKIADVLGQQTVSMARHYSESAQLDPGTKAAILKLPI